MERSWAVWRLLFGLSLGVWVLVLAAVFLLDWEVPPLLLAVLVLCGLALSGWRFHLKNQRKPSNSR